MGSGLALELKVQQAAGIVARRLGMGIADGLYYVTSRAGQQRLVLLGVEMSSEQSGVLDESVILDHAQSPYHRGRAPNANCAHTERNAACGDWVRLELVLEADGRVQQAWFDGGGCLVSQAAASILCQAVEGKSIGELRELTAQQVLDWLEIPLTPRRMQCGLLPFKVLKTMVYGLDPAANVETRWRRE